MKKKFLFIFVCLVLLLVPITIGKTGLNTNIVFAEGETTTPEVGASLGDGSDDCAGIGTVVYYGVYVVRVIQIVAPIVLIIWGSIDLIKSIISGDEKKIAAARKPFIQRLISAVIIFLLPWVVNVVIGFATGEDKDDQGWVVCWKAAWHKGEKPSIGGNNLGLWDK